MARISGSASAEIDAPVEQVWVVVEEVLTAPDCRAAWWRCWRWSTMRTGPALVEVDNDLGVRHIKTRVRFRYEPPTRHSWTQERG